MFGRRKSVDAQGSETAVALKPDGKGRPTPKRSQAQAGNRRPLVGNAKTATSRSKDERRAAWQQTTAAHKTEDQRFLPVRDRGMVRRFARDVVDGRRNIGEFFLPVALLVLLLSAVPYAFIQLGAAVVLYLILGVLIVDSFLLYRAVKSKVRDKFGAEAAAERGLGMYAVMRGFQMRRMRRPNAQVKHGGTPR